MRNQIPIRTHSWDISQPGFMEADTVAHCGNSLAGDFIWSLLQNHFIPSFKLIEKKRINSKYYKTYDKPRTVFERVVGSKQVSKQSKDRLKKQYQSLDPFKLKLQIDRQLKSDIQTGYGNL